MSHHDILKYHLLVNGLLPLKIDLKNPIINSATFWIHRTYPIIARRAVYLGVVNIF